MIGFIEADHHPDDDGERDEHVRGHEAGVRVDQMESHEQHEEGDQERDERREAGDQQDQPEFSESEYHRTCDEDRQGGDRRANGGGGAGVAERLVPAQ
jgi:hypothetical protein